MYNGTKVLDIHAHVSGPGNGGQYLALLLASNTPLPADPRGKGAPQFGIGEQGWAASLKRHVDMMDDHNIDAQLIGPRPFMMMGWMQKHLLPRWTRFVNHMIAHQCTVHPTRFAGAAMLPQNADAPDLKHCLPELEYCHNELGFAGAYLSPDPTGDRRSPGMDDPYWDPVYAYCEKHGLPIIVHGTNCTDPRLKTIPHNYQIGFVWEQYLATQLLSHGDVFKRFPGLKVVMCHCGGALDRFIKTDHHLGQQDLSKNLFFDTCVHDIDYLEAGIKQRTVKQIVFGTEVPGSGGALRPETGKQADDLVPIIGAMKFLSDKDKVDIFHHNVAKVCPALAKISA